MYSYSRGFGCSRRKEERFLLKKNGEQEEKLIEAFNKIRICSVKLKDIKSCIRRFDIVFTQFGSIRIVVKGLRWVNFWLFLMGLIEAFSSHNSVENSSLQMLMNNFGCFLAFNVFFVFGLEDFQEPEKAWWRISILSYSKLVGVPSDPSNIFPRDEIALNNYFCRVIVVWALTCWGRKTRVMSSRKLWRQSDRKAVRNIFLLTHFMMLHRFSVASIICPLVRKLRKFVLVLSTHLW